MEKEMPSVDLLVLRGRMLCDCLFIYVFIYGHWCDSKYTPLGEFAHRVVGGRRFV